MTRNETGQSVHYLLRGLLRGGRQPDGGMDFHEIGNKEVDRDEDREGPLTSGTTESPRIMFCFGATPLGKGRLLHSHRDGSSFMPLPDHR